MNLGVYCVYLGVCLGVQMGVYCVCWGIKGVQIRVYGVFLGDKGVFFGESIYFEKGCVFWR